VTYKLPVRSSGFIQTFVLEADATSSLRKVKNLRGEQNRLERRAIDSDSLVRQVSQTLSFILSSRSGHVQS
jgi:hypothetical protein